MKKKTGEILNKIPTAVIILVSLAIFNFVWSIQQHNMYVALCSTAEAVTVENGQTSADNEGRLIYATGSPVISTQPQDPLTDFTADSLVVVRKAEMYQYWTDGNTVYSGFRSGYEGNIEGNGETYSNPAFPDEIKETCFIADASVDGGNLRLNEDAIWTLAGGDLYSTVLVPADDLSACKGDYAATVAKDEDVTYLFSGKNYDAPEIGDVRICYLYLPADSAENISILGVQQDSAVCRNESGDMAYVSPLTETYDDIISNSFGSHESASFALKVLAGVMLAAAVIIYLVKNGFSGKKKAQKFACIVAAMLVCSMSLGIAAKADFGDYGGDSDYGGWDSGGWDSGGYDSGDWDSGDWDFGSDDDDHEYNNPTVYHYVYGDDLYYPSDLVFMYLGAVTTAEMLQNLSDFTPADSSAGSVAGLFFLLAIIDIILIMLKRKAKPRRKPPKRIEGATATDSSLLNSVSGYSDLDEKFSADEFTRKVSSLYVQFQNAWQSKNIEPLRPYMTDAFYAQIDRQLGNYRRNRQTNMVEDINVTNCSVRGWYQSEGNDVMVVTVCASIRDYVVSDDTLEVVRGSRDAVKKMEYEWILVRPTGTLTGGEETQTKVCPNCGAPIDINSAGKCEYCGSIIETKAVDWAVSAIKGISQRTVGG